jgi:hypothetical protein
MGHQCLCMLDSENLFKFSIQGVPGRFSVCHHRHCVTSVVLIQDSSPAGKRQERTSTFAVRSQSRPNRAIFLVALGRENFPGRRSITDSTPGEGYGHGPFQITGTPTGTLRPAW